MNNMTTTTDAPSEKQLAFIERLAAERPSTLVPSPTTKRDASSTIDWLLTLPREKNLNAGGDSTLQVLLRDVPDAFYALPSKTGTNDLDFVAVVTRGERRYVNRYLGGQGQVHIRAAEQRAFAQHLSALAPEQLYVFRTVFGIELGRCCGCGRELTDETSRALGVGPECRRRA